MFLMKYEIQTTSLVSGNMPSLSPVYGESGTYLVLSEHLNCGNRRMVSSRRFF